MRKWIFNNEEFEGIKMKYATFEKIGKPKGVFKYRGKKYFHQFGGYSGCYCFIVAEDYAVYQNCDRRINVTS